MTLGIRKLRVSEKKKKIDKLLSHDHKTKRGHVTGETTSQH